MSDRISIRDLTAQLENGDGHSVSNAFSGKFEEERFRVLDEIKKLNQTDLTSGKTKTELSIDYRFYTTDHISINSIKSGWDKFAGNKPVYQDELNLDNLKHSDTNDKVPSVRQPVDIKKLTKAAEDGDGKAIESALNGKFQEERAVILHGLVDQNKADLAAGQTTATLDVSVGGAKLRAGEMTVTRELPTIHDYWMGGVQIYGETLDAATGNRTTLAKEDSHK